MKLPRKIILIVFLLSPNLAIAAESLPYELIAYMKSLDIKYEPIDKSDLSEDMIDDYKSLQSKPEVQIVNDFDGDGRVDYALLLSNRDIYVSVVVFLDRGDSYTHRVIRDMTYRKNHDKTNIRMIMSPVAGSVKGIEGTLELENGGIYVTCYYCPGSAVYYWDEGDFSLLPTSD